MKTVAILALERVFDSPFAVSLDILSSARRIHWTLCGGTVQVKSLICGVGGRRLSTGEGLGVPVDTKLSDLKKVDMVIVPGLGIRHILQLFQAIPKLT